MVTTKSGSSGAQQTSCLRRILLAGSKKRSSVIEIVQLETSTVQLETVIIEKTEENSQSVPAELVGALAGYIQPEERKEDEIKVKTNL